MIIEVRGTGVHNKGAELMLCAIKQYFAEKAPDVQLAVGPQFGPFAARAKYGLLTKLPSRRRGRSMIASWVMSPSFRNTYGIVAEDDIDAVLDASGFAFSDQWGAGPSRQLAKESARRTQKGKTFVLLPQALGPFSDADVRAGFREALEHLSLVFARDSASMQYVRELGSFDNVKQAPDFTTIVKGVRPDGLELPERFACIVPNIRMLDRTSEDDQGAYVGFLADAVTGLESHGIQPLLLFHDPKHDRKVAAELQAKLGRELPVIESDDPIHLKGVIGCSTAVVGSRFHALVGALSQAVPSIAAGWSHKYDMLFDEYGCGRFVIAPSGPRQALTTLIDEIGSEAGHASLRASLEKHAAELKRQAIEMFEQVHRVLKH